MGVAPCPRPLSWSVLPAPATLGADLRSHAVDRRLGESSITALRAEHPPVSCVLSPGGNSATELEWVWRGSSAGMRLCHVLSQPLSSHGHARTLAAEPRGCDPHRPEESLGSPRLVPGRSRRPWTLGLSVWSSAPRAQQCWPAGQTHRGPLRGWFPRLEPH